MIKSNTVKRLIGTGAIAFAFFSASLAMGTPVKAEGTVKHEAILQEESSTPYQNGFSEGHEAGYEYGKSDEALNPRDPKTEKNLPIPQLGNDFDEDYIQGFEDGFRRGFLDGWLDKNEPLSDETEDSLGVGNLESEQIDGTLGTSFFDTVLEFFSYVYTTVTAFFS